MSPAQDPAAGETGIAASRIRHAHAHSLSGTITTRPRRTTAQSDIHETILHPGNVKINVQGAFIVDEEQPGTPQSEDYEHDPKDIRLPNHTAVVSHIAVDVSTAMPV
jgi:type II pantothenate kinase